MGNGRGARGCTEISSLCTRIAPDPPQPPVGKIEAQSSAAESGGGGLGGGGGRVLVLRVTLAELGSLDSASAVPASVPSPSHLGPLGVTGGGTAAGGGGGGAEGSVQGAGGGAGGGADGAGGVAGGVAGGQRMVNLLFVKGHEISVAYFRAG